MEFPKNLLDILGLEAKVQSRTFGVMGGDTKICWWNQGLESVCAPPEDAIGVCAIAHVIFWKFHYIKVRCTDLIREHLSHNTAEVVVVILQASVYTSIE